MKVFCLLLVFLVSKANSQLDAISGFQGGAEGSFNAFIDFPLCLIQGITAFGADDVGSVCTGLSLQPDNPAAKALLPLCSAVSGTLTAVSNIFTPLCPNGPPDSAMIPPSCPNGIKSTTLTNGFGSFVGLIYYPPVCLIGSITASVATNITKICLMLPGQDNDAGKGLNFICTLIASIIGAFSETFSPLCPYGPQDPKILLENCLNGTQDTTPSSMQSTTSMPTMPNSCTDDFIRHCNKQCKSQEQYTYTLGGICTMRGNQYSCECKPVTNCETYQNATCKQECKSAPSICRIPDEGLPCVCKYQNAFGPRYVLPNSTYVA